MDFVLKYGETIVPIEVKYRNMNTPKLTRGFQSFLKAYNPKSAFIITKSFSTEIKVDNSKIYFITLENILSMLQLL